MSGSFDRMHHDDQFKKDFDDIGEQLDSLEDSILAHLEQAAKQRMTLAEAIDKINALTAKNQQLIAELEGRDVPWI